MIRTILIDPVTRTVQEAEIDPVTRTVQEAEYDGTLAGIYGLVACQTITAAGLQTDDMETIYVDDEGLFSGQPFFLHDDYPQPLAGRGIIVGTDDEGGDTPPVRSLTEHADRITFGNPHDLMRKCEADHPGLSL